ncbi:hypothetical protein SteCoe_23678 [Stentor coeruleus]|uniref:Uncharacterized protein n=1 Tax=Stentor coeruleus TaxID=5963 RepID=A0A1R2BJB7_9CILI|nr:hypothetical protein SteCoe_23678 [Stentor coeruleus]
MAAISEARSIQKEIQECKKEIILLEKELRRNGFEEAFQAKLSIQEKLRQEMVSLNSELQQLRQEILKIKQVQEEVEKQEAENMRSQIEQVKKENIHLIAQEEQMKKSEHLLDLNQQNYIYGIYQRRLGPTERENADLTKKIKKCEEDIEKLKSKCENVKFRYPSTHVEKLKLTHEHLTEVQEKENAVKHQISLLENEIKALKSLPKQNTEEILQQIQELTLHIEKDRIKSAQLEKKIKEKTHELRLAKLTIPKVNGSHSMYKDIELLNCILADKIGELSDITIDIEDLEEKINSLST